MPARRTAVNADQHPGPVALARIDEPAPPALGASSSAIEPGERASWGRYPAVQHRGVVSVPSRDATIDFASDASFLGYGQGRSYGDSCLNQDGVLLDNTRLRRFISFDESTGLLRCEAGVTLAEVLEFCVPRGWFLPTTPGTKFVSIAGAIANDIHGKNHHVAGTFGRHVTCFELVRSDGQRLLCSPAENAGLYRATIGGLGLTGFITWAEFRLKRVPGPYIAMESIRFRSLDEFFEVSADSDKRFEYTMSWVDCMATGASLGRGLFMRGNHAWQKRIPRLDPNPRQRIGIPLDLPEIALNGLTVKAFNTLLYYKQLPPVVTATTPYDPFFYPLDSISNWNRMYGRRGFLQHQCVVPHESASEALRAIFKATGESGQGSFLAVLKTFGDLPSPGMLSFPRPGATLALDFPFHGESTLRLLDSLDDIAIGYGGAIYPAKDAHMSRRTFEASFPRWRDFAQYADPKFSSSFWRRVIGADSPEIEA